MEMPHDMAAEKAVIAGLLLEPSTIEKVDHMLREPEVFWRTTHQVVYEAMKDLWKKDTHFDGAGLVGHITAAGKINEVGGEDGLTDYFMEILQGLYSTYGIERQAKVLVACYVKRVAMRGGDRLRNMAQLPINSTDDVITEAFNVYNEINNARGTVDKSTDAVDIADIVVKKAAEGQLKGHDLGFYRLNQLIGGLVWGGLYYIGARPGKGKTALLMNIATNNTMANDEHSQEPVGVWTSEMPEEQIVGRLISSVSGVDGTKFKNGLLNDDEKAMVEDGLARLKQGRVLRVDATETYTVHDLINVFRNWNRRYGIRIFFVDYVQNFKWSPNVDNRFDMIRESSNALKSFALATNSIVISCAQLSRKAEERKGPPLMSDLEGASALEQDADGIMMLHKKTDTKYSDPTANFQIRLVKNRHGPTGFVNMVFEKALLRFRERTSLDDSEE